jgi:hypothetical protein
VGRSLRGQQPRGVACLANSLRALCIQTGYVCLIAFLHGDDGTAGYHCVMWWLVISNQQHTCAPHCPVPRMATTKVWRDMPGWKPGPLHPVRKLHTVKLTWRLTTNKKDARPGVRC